MTRGSARYLAILACMTFVIAAVATPDERAAVTVATVQFRVTEEAYSSVAAYRDTVEEIVERAVNDHSADIVVFPEYLNVFLVAARFPRVVESASTIEEALRLIAAEQVGRDPSGERGQINVATIQRPQWTLQCQLLLLLALFFKQVFSLDLRISATIPEHPLADR